MKPSLKILKPVEDMNEHDAQLAAQLSPQQHLQNANIHIRKVFGKKLEQPMQKKLNFK